MHKLLGVSVSCKTSGGGKCSEPAVPEHCQQIQSPFVSRKWIENVGRHPTANMSGCSECYGNILNVDTTGALGTTVKADGVSCKFLPQRRQQKNMEKYQAKMAKAGNGEGLAPALIDCWCFLSRAGTELKDGLGDHGNAFGLIQAGKQHHKIGKPWNTEEHLGQDTEILYRMINPEKKSLSWTEVQHLRGGISAYNAGVNSVQTYDKMGIGKIHNYASDGDVRPRFYKKNGIEISE
nr:lysozyme g-like [Agelaius phoeniceus]